MQCEVVGGSRLFLAAEPSQELGAGGVEVVVALQLEPAAETGVAAGIVERHQGE
jgi:hypothetical protein